VSDTRIVFADQLTTGDVLTEPCLATERNPGACYIKATRHEPGHVHERVVLDIRRDSAVVLGIAVDEDGEQQPLGYGPNATLRIRIRDTFPAEQPAEETR
jgi:hypothetical protein